MPKITALPDVVLLDGGMGRELRFRGVEILDTIWSANALLTAPDVVRDIHRDYIAAGADIITTNTYSTIRADLAKEGIEDQFERLNLLACSLAIEARAESAKPVWIAGSLPPLHGSYRPDLVRPFEEIEPLYREQAAILAPHVDLFLCETMSSAVEALAAASAASRTGKPVWVSFTLHEDQSDRLASFRISDQLLRPRKHHSSPTRADRLRCQTRRRLRQHLHPCPRKLDSRRVRAN
ncbi:hypothetical protein BH23CHL5_BH23CHL5_28550 [soil metagenome]